MKKTAFLFLFMFLSGCATSKTLMAPDGGEFHHINCSGTMMTWAECYEKAGKLCPHGYTVQNIIGQNQGSTATFNQFGFFSSPVVMRELFITCNENAKPDEQEITIHNEEKKSYDTNK